MKIIPFYPNQSDDLHCLQACIKSILKYYFPDKTYSYKEIDKSTNFSGGWSWLPASVIWLNSLGLKANLYLSKEKFDYKMFSELGEKYLKDKWDKQRFKTEEQAGALKNLPDEQKYAKEMVGCNLWINRDISTDDLSSHLKNQNTLAIGKTVYEWMDGNFVFGNSHFVTVIKKYSPSLWLVHDPGLPPSENRKIPVEINNHSLFGDVLLVEKLT